MQGNAEAMEGPIYPEAAGEETLRDYEGRQKKFEAYAKGFLEIFSETAANPILAGLYGSLLVSPHREASAVIPAALGVAGMGFYAFRFLDRFNQNLADKRKTDYHKDVLDRADQRLKAGEAADVHWTDEKSIEETFKETFKKEIAIKNINEGNRDGYVG